jgi:hypothetical protein
MFMDGAQGWNAWAIDKLIAWNANVRRDERERAIMIYEKAFGQSPTLFAAAIRNPKEPI